MRLLILTALLVLPTLALAQSEVTESDINQIMARMNEVEGPVVLNSCDKPQPKESATHKTESQRSPAVVEQFGRNLGRNR